MFLAIDPGIDTGWAVLDAGGTLHACGLGEDFPCLSNRAAVIERPQVYQASKSKGNPNDLITLAIRVGRYQQRLLGAGVLCPDANLVLPTTWKGQVPKGIHHARIDASLSQIEREVLSPWKRTATGDGKAGNVWDAVGLAKWAFLNRRFANLAA